MKLTGNTKSKLNLSIDIVMFILLLAMAGIGFLMKFVVFTGEVRNVKYGNNVDLEFLGLNRHQWGSIHLTISIIFLALLVLHIILHWKCIVSIYKCLFPSLFTRYTVIIFILIVSGLTLISPFFLKPEMVPFEPQYRNRNNLFPSSGLLIQEAPEKDSAFPAETVGAEKPGSPANSRKQPDEAMHEDHHNSEYDEFEVYGNQTLQFVADRYNVPAAVISRDLRVPENLAGERLSRLRKQYAFTMTDVRKSIYEYKRTLSGK